MSDRDLTLQILFTALKNVDNWFVFGTMLGVPDHELRKIERAHPGDPERWKLDMLRYWLNNESETTWNHVVHALEKTSHRALAANIRREFIEGKGIEQGQSTAAFVERLESDLRTQLQCCVEQGQSTAASLERLESNQADFHTQLHGCVEQGQSTAASVERLQSNQADLRAQLQCYEQDLKTANEKLRMMETAIIVAAHKRNTDVEERISHLEMESRKKIEDLKSSLDNEIKKLKARLKKNEETIANLRKKNSQSELAHADMMAVVHRRDSYIEELKMKIEKLMKEIEELKSNRQPQSSVPDSTHQLNDKRDTLETEGKNSKDSVNRHKKSGQTELDPETAPSVSQFQAKQTAVGHPKLEILVCGSTRVGKSSLINSLLGRNVCKVGDPGLFTSEDSLGAYTRSTVQFSLTLSNSIEVSIYDSPGLDGTEDEKKYLDDMYSKCKDVDLVLYCMDMTSPRFSPQEACAISLITKKFCPTIWERCVLVLTKANQVHVPQKWRKTSSAIIEYHKNKVKSVQEMFCSCLEKHGVSARVCKGLQVVAAGCCDWGLERDYDYDERLIVFASERSMADPGPPLVRVDFITELWVACLETVPATSRIRYLQATALGGRIIVNDGKADGHLSQRRILKMAAKDLDKNIQSVAAVHVGSRPKLKTDDNSGRTCCLM